MLKFKCPCRGIDTLRTFPTLTSCNSVGLFGSRYWKGLDSSSVFKQAFISNL